MEKYLFQNSAALYSNLSEEERRRIFVERVEHLLHPELGSFFSLVRLVDLMIVSNQVQFMAYCKKIYLLSFLLPPPLALLLADLCLHHNQVLMLVLHHLHHHMILASF
jgi:hypothetical protein